MITKQKGTYDIYGDNAKKRAYVNEILATLSEKYGYGYIETPVLKLVNFSIEVLEKLQIWFKKKLMILKIEEIEI